MQSLHFKTIIPCYILIYAKCLTPNAHTHTHTHTFFALIRIMTKKMVKMKVIRPEDNQQSKLLKMESNEREHKSVSLQVTIIN